MSMKGMKHSEETKKKMSERRKGRKQSPEWIAKRGAALKGRVITWGDKLSEAHIGLKASDETKKKMSESRRGEKNHQFGKPLTQEHKEKISKMRIEKKLGSGKNNGQYIDGRSYFPYCFKFNNRRRHAVRTFFDFTCISCGCHQEENIIYLKGKGYRFEKLPVHHVDHDKEQGCNGKPFNLVPMCRRCHMKEGNNLEEYRQYVNKTLQEGFNWGIWSESEYQRLVMYEE